MARLDGHGGHDGLGQRRRRAAGWALALGLSMFTLAGGGCQTSKHAGLGDIEYPDDAARMAEAQALASKAQEAARAKQPLEAIEYYKQAVMTYRKFHSAWNNLGVLLMEQGKFLEAREAFTVAMDLEPRDPEPAANLGALYQIQRWYDDAAKYYAIALERSPYHAKSLYEAVRVDQLRGVRTQTTLDVIRRALEVEKDRTKRDYLERQKAVVEGQLRSPYR